MTIGETTAFILKQGSFPYPVKRFIPTDKHRNRTLRAYLRNSNDFLKEGTHYMCPIKYKAYKRTELN